MPVQYLQEGDENSQICVKKFEPAGKVLVTSNKDTNTRMLNNILRQHGVKSCEPLDESKRKFILNFVHLEGILYFFGKGNIICYIC